MKQNIFIYITCFILFYSQNLQSQNLQEISNAQKYNPIIYNAAYPFENSLIAMFRNGELKNYRNKISTYNSICKYFNDTLDLDYSTGKDFVGGRFKLQIIGDNYKLRAYKWSCGDKQEYEPIYSKITLEKNNFNVGDSIKVHLEALLVHEAPFRDYKDTLEIFGSLNFKIRNKEYSQADQQRESHILEFYEMANSRPDTIKSLYLDDLNWTEIPNEIKKFINLETLDLGDNKIKMEEFDKISGLVKLKELSVYENGLSEFPKVIFKLKSLEVLNLNENNLTTIPRGLSKLKKLKELYIEENAIKKFPKVLYRMKNVEYLNIDEDEIEDSEVKMKRFKETRSSTIKK